MYTYRTLVYSNETLQRPFSTLLFIAMVTFRDVHQHATYMLLSCQDTCIWHKKYCLGRPFSIKPESRTWGLDLVN